MKYKLTDIHEKAFLYGVIVQDLITNESNKKTLRCGFSWNSIEEAEQRSASSQCITMADREMDEDEVYILRSAWMHVRDGYKMEFGLPKEIEDLDIQFNCVCYEID